MKWIVQFIQWNEMKCNVQFRWWNEMKVNEVKLNVVEGNETDMWEIKKKKQRQEK